jgi:hypothetical protein
VGKNRLGSVIYPCLLSVTFSLGYDDNVGGGGGGSDNDVKLV